MIKVEKIEVLNFDCAIRGMRNPLESWDKSDSFNCHTHNMDCDNCKMNGKNCQFYKVGDNDLDLMKRLYKAGEPHRKYLRQIFVSMDITAPLYWWKEADTYKVGTVADSCSTMHKIHSKEITAEDFSIDDCDHMFESVIRDCEYLRKKYVETKDKTYWRKLIQLLPESYNQKRTFTLNYEIVFNMIKYRQGHKLSEWNEFCDILKDLPYIREICDNDFPKG